MTATLDAPAVPGPRPFPGGSAGSAPAADAAGSPAAGSPAGGSPAADSLAAGCPAPISPAPDSPVVVRRLPPPRPVAVPLPPGPVPAAAQRPPERPGDPRAEVGIVLRLALEILDGRRPPSRLGGRLSPSVARYLVAARTRLEPPARRAVARRARHGPPGLHTLRLCHPTDRATEASAVWRHRGRFRALAARFEWAEGRWRCTELRLG